MAKTLNSDKFVVYVVRDAGAHPQVRINKCNRKGTLGKGQINLTPRAIWYRDHTGKDDYAVTALKIGEKILNNSSNVKKYNRKRKAGH